MHKFPDFAAVIFDLDGLVLDTEPTYFAAWEHALGSMGYPGAKAFCHTLAGMAYSAITDKILATYGTDFNLDHFAAQSSQFWEGLVAKDGITIRPGFQALIEIIQQRDIRYCIATNSLGAKARRNLTLAGLSEVFPLILSRDQVKQGKPEPEIYLKAAHSINVEISACLVLEDSYPGVLAAHRAGAMVAYIPSNTPDLAASALANWQFDSLHSIAEIILASFPSKKLHPV